MSHLCGHLGFIQRLFLPIVDSVVVDLEARDKLLAELEEKPLHILELDFEMLHSQITYLPGTRDKRGGAVIVIRSYGSCWDNLEVSSLELAKLFMYFYKIPRQVYIFKHYSYVGNHP